jgi:plastocyanin
VRSSKRHLLLVAVLGAALAVLPAIASSETAPTIEAVNEPGSGLYAEEHHHWSPTQATVGAGGEVTLKNATTVPHGVRWVGGPATPTCSSGVPVGTEASSSGANWSGTCKFTQAGTYTFYCTVHGAEMTSTITVSASGPSPTPTTPTTPGGTTITTTPTTPETTLGSPLAGNASEAIKLVSSQHGKSVHGAIDVSSAGAGGRLEVDLLAKSASLAKAKHSVQLSVGRLVRRSLRAGAVSFTVALNAKARHALSTHHRLALTVKIMLTPPHGATVTIKRSVVVHG